MGNLQVEGIGKEELLAYLKQNKDSVIKREAGDQGKKDKKRKKKDDKFEMFEKS